MSHLKAFEILKKIQDNNFSKSLETNVSELLDIFQQAGAPLIIGDTTVVFLYHGPAKKVALIGDMTEWKTFQPLERIAGTDLFFYQTELPADARLEYNFQIDDAELLTTDSLNPHLSLNGLGDLSELAMPAYQHHPLFKDFRTGQKGPWLNIETHTLPPGKLPYPHTIHVYLPPNYHKNNAIYPTVYFQDGEDYIEFAQVPYVLNQLIEEGLIPPLVAVFEAPPNRHIPDTPNRMTQYGLNDDYVDFFSDQLVQFVESHYRLQSAPESRLVVGDSFGGLISAYIAFSRPDFFGLCYSQSGYASFQNDALIAAYRDASPRPIRMYVDVGHFERSVGAAFLPEAEQDFLLANRRFEAVLRTHNYDFVYREYPEGHTWGNWRRHLIDALIHFFGA